MHLNLKRQCETYLACAALLAGIGAPAMAQLQTVQTSAGPLVIPYPQVPTDVTGIGGSLGHAQGIRQLLLGPDRNTLPGSHGAIVCRDPRYNFTGIWSPIEWGNARVAMLPDTGIAAVVPNTGISGFQPAPLAAVIPTAVPVETSAMDRVDAAITPGDLDATVPPAIAQLMPTCGAAYSVCAPNNIQLSHGALLIKVNEQPVYVSSAMCGNGVSVRLARGAFAMVSMLNGRFVVANLADSGQDSVVLNVGDRTRCDSGAVPVRVGFLAELHANGVACSENELVAYTIPNTIPMTDGLTLEMMRVSYPRTLKRFNITRMLTDCDLRRVMKTAAAVSYVDSEREWNGLAIPSVR
ncbi:MAG TPA: hypothetical protein V6D22_07445 [Candidatus Obscuribacterales bacterium]